MGPLVRLNMTVIPSQGVVGDVGERGPPGPDGKEVRSPSSAVLLLLNSPLPSEEPPALLRSDSVTLMCLCWLFSCTNS